jgi:hypothetical protein
MTYAINLLCRLGIRLPAIICLPAIAILVPGLAAADPGLGSMAGLFILGYLLALPIPISALILFAVSWRLVDESGNRRFPVAPFALWLPVILYLWLGHFIGKPDSADLLNPWVGGDSGVISAFMLIVVWGAALAVVRGAPSLVGVCVVFLAFLVVKAGTTPGAILLYPHDPLGKLEVAALVQFDPKHVSWDGKMFRTSGQSVNLRPSEPAALIRDGEQIRIVVQRSWRELRSIPHEGPRRERPQSSDTEQSTKRWSWNNPLTPTRRTVNIAREITELDKGWLAEGTHLEYAIRHGRNEEWLKTLIQHGASPDFVNPDHGRSMLGLAVGGSKFEFAETLMANGADIDLLDAHGNSVVHHYAQSQGLSQHRFEFLLSHGADPFVENGGNLTVIDILNRIRADENAPQSERDKAQQRVELLRLNICSTLTAPRSRAAATFCLAERLDSLRNRGKTPR